MLPKMRCQRVYTWDCCPWFQADNGPRNLTKPLVRNARDSGFGNRGMQHKCPFDRLGQDFKSAAHDRPVGASAVE